MLSLSLSDTCQGDSGGPIMYYSQAQRAWVLAGITSYGRGCGLPNYAGVYTRVSAYMDWIRSTVGNDGVVFIAQSKAQHSGASNLILIIAMLFSIVVRIYNPFHWNQSSNQIKIVDRNVFAAFVIVSSNPFLLAIVEFHNHGFGKQHFISRFCLSTQSFSRKILRISERNCMISRNR